MSDYGPKIDDPVWVRQMLGMPFLRRYFVGFDGRGRAKASDVPSILASIRWPVRVYAYHTFTDPHQQPEEKPMPEKSKPLTLERLTAIVEELYPLATHYVRDGKYTIRVFGEDNDGRKYQEIGLIQHYALPCDHELALGSQVKCNLPEITDEYAAQWPRKLVMVRDRDDEPWAGPLPLLSVVPTSNHPFGVLNHEIRRPAYRIARHPTPEELAEAGAGKDGAEA